MKIQISLSAKAKPSDETGRTRSGAIGSKKSDPKDARASWLLNKVDPSKAQYEKPVGGASAQKFETRVLELSTLEGHMDSATKKAWAKLKSKAIVGNILKKHPQAKPKSAKSAKSNLSLEAQLRDFRLKHSAEIEAFYDMQRQYPEARTPEVKEKIRKLRTKNVETYLDMRRQLLYANNTLPDQKVPSKKEILLQGQLKKYEDEAEALNLEMYGPSGKGNENITDAQFDALAKKLNLVQKKIYEVQRKIFALNKN